MKKNIKMLILAVLIIIAFENESFPQTAELSIPNEHIKILLIETPGGFSGIDIISNNSKIGRIVFGPAGRFYAKKVEKKESGNKTTLILSEFDTVQLNNSININRSSKICISLEKDKLYPEIEFDFKVDNFSKEEWINVWGKDRPLTLFETSLHTDDNYQMCYFGGWLYPGLLVDPFPVNAAGYGWSIDDNGMRGKWDKGWSYAVPMPSLSMPGLGMWAPEKGVYLGLDFSISRFVDKSSRDLSIVYYTGDSQVRQFAALVYPYADNCDKVVYPNAPFSVGSKADILWSQDLYAYNDPNMFYQERIWKEYRHLLPSVPNGVNVDWVFRENDPYYSKDNIYLGTIPQEYTNLLGLGSSPPGGPKLFDSSEAVVTYEEGAEVIKQFKFEVGSLMESAYLNNTGLEVTKDQINKIMKMAKTENINGDNCLYWEHPLIGDYNDKVGGKSARSRHYDSTWNPAAAMLIIYKYEGTKEYLPYIDGVFNWTKHFLYTRGGVFDQPHATFLGWLPRSAVEGFLLNYHHVFKDDPERGENAVEALELARMIIHKNLLFFLGDPDPNDSLDPTFHMTVNNDRWWMGKISWCETSMVLKALIPVYLETGDEFLKYALYGLLDRWWVGLGVNENETIDNPHYIENIIIMGDDKGKRTPSSTQVFLNDAFFRYVYPARESIARILVGPKGHLVFKNGDYPVSVKNYRYGDPNKIQFEIATNRQGNFTLVLSSPYRSFHNETIYVNGKRCEPSQYEINDLTNGEDVYLYNLKAGDEIRIGETINQAVSQYTDNIKYFGFSDIDNLNGVYKDYSIVNLWDYVNARLYKKWGDAESYFSFLAGAHTYNSIPFYLIDANSNGEREIVEKQSISVKMNKPVKGIAVFVVSENMVFPECDFEIVLTDGAKINITEEITTENSKNLFWLNNALPLNNFPFQQWALYPLVYIGSKEMSIAGLNVLKGKVAAVTLLKDASGIGLSSGNEVDNFKGLTAQFEGEIIPVQVKGTEENKPILLLGKEGSEWTRILVEPVSGNWKEGSIFELSVKAKSGYSSEIALEVHNDGVKDREYIPFPVSTSWKKYNAILKSNIPTTSIWCYIYARKTGKEVRPGVFFDDIRLREVKYDTLFLNRADER